MARKAQTKQTTKTTSAEGTMNAKGGAPVGPTKGTNAKAPAAKGAVDSVNGLKRITY